MAQTMVTLRMDTELKKKMEEECRSMGISMTAAFTMFATKMTQEHRIPFEITSQSIEKVNEGTLQRIMAYMDAAGIRFELPDTGNDNADA